MTTFVNPADQAIRLINYIGAEVTRSGVPIRQLTDVQVREAIGAPTAQFAIHIVDELHSKGLVSIGVPSKMLDGSAKFWDVNLSLDGWEQYNATKRGELHGGYGFMAMQFPRSSTRDPYRLDEFVQNVVRPTTKDATGCDLIDMRDVAEAGVIDNIMRDRIRSATFAIVDLTHNNRGAYWEAGYAEGLGKPVVYICQRSAFDRVHFDTNHCTTVLWSWDSNERFRAELAATLRRSLDSRLAEGHT